MGWLGFTARPRVAVALAAPFVLYLVWIDLETRGAPMLSDPFGWMIVAFVLGPYVISWLVYFIGKFRQSMKPRPGQV
jgi:hypothetical protein